MTALITLIGEVFAMDIATIGTTDITLGLVAAGGLVVSLAVGVFQRVRR